MPPKRHTWRRHPPLLPLMAIALLVAGCAGLHLTPPEGREQLAGREWWNFYLRGRARFDTGNVRGAREDFERCLGLRPGSSSIHPAEAWIARTYGMRTLDLYFPRRELGICLHLEGDDRAARPLLERSLQDLPTERARHYLNRILKLDAAAAHAGADDGNVPAICSTTASSPPALCAPDAPERDRLPPRLRTSDNAGVIRTGAEEWLLKGEAADRGGLASVLVQGENWMPAAAEPPDYAVFSGLLPLQPGTNHFDVVALDLAGNHSPTSRVTVVREPPQYVLPEHRLAATLQWIHDPERKLSDRANLARKFVETAFQSGRLPRFRLLARDEERLRSLLTEQKISLSGLADKRLALPYGQISTADLMVFLQYDEYGTNRLPVVVAHVVEAETGAVLFTEDVFVHDTPDLGLKDQLRGLASLVESRFPVVSGRVTGSEGRGAVTDLARPSGVRPGARFLVAADPAAPPVSPEDVRRQGERFVEVVLTAVEDVSSRARLVPASSNGLIQPGDRIYAR